MSTSIRVYLRKIAWVVPILAIFFMSTNSTSAKAMTEPVSRGEGGGILEGYVISNQVFHLNENNPAKVDSVEFEIAGSPKAKVSLVRLDDGGVWYDCILSKQADRVIAMCDTTSVVHINVVDINEFRVIAYE